MKTYVIGDIHGRYDALKEVLTACKFDYNKDKLIFLGDIVDGGYNTYLVIEELLKIKNKILIRGNHCDWFINHIENGFNGEIWLSQGGRETLKSYKKDGEVNIPVTHQEFLNTGKYYHIENKMLFVHGGFDTKLGIENTPKEVLVWDRKLIDKARWDNIKGYKKIFVGHTTTQYIDNKTEPLFFNNLIMMDCGAGWSGKLAIMNINTEEYWTSKIQRPAQREVQEGMWQC